MPVNVYHIKQYQMTKGVLTVTTVFGEVIISEGERAKRNLKIIQSVMDKLEKEILKDWADQD
jgi:hypothetical protein